MHAQSDTLELLGLLRRARQRLSWIAALNGAAFGFAAATLIDRSLASGMALALAGAIIAAWVHTPRMRGQTALEIERRAPVSRNLILTATELLDDTTRVTPPLRALVTGEANRVAPALNVASLFPLRGALTVLGAAMAVWGAVLLLVTANPAASLASATDDAALGEIDDVEIAVAGPAYAGRPPRTLRNPERVEALAGSTLRVVIRAHAAALVVETITGRDTIHTVNDGRFEHALIADADGYVAIEPLATDGAPGVRRLIGLSVTPDHAPSVRITAPARDVLYPDGRRTLDVTIEAADDIALSSLRLRYTRVSGSGERFEFTEADVPVSVTRTNGAAWSARGTLRLDTLSLGAGDVVVYRGIAADSRPGALPVESDAFIVEITSPGGVAAEGFATDDLEDRYGLSQQMVILRTRQIIARRAAIPAAALADSALMLAALQRRVRAEFVFMLGGEQAEEVLQDAAGLLDLDEHAHADADEELLAGRLANQARLELLRAIRSMSRAATALTSTQVDTALVHENEALTHLQNAFTRTRYILRALTQRERLDLTRRMTGVLAGALGVTAPLVVPTADSIAVELRGAIAGIATLAGASELGVDDARLASQLAARVLRADPSSRMHRDAAGFLTRAATAIADSENAVARGALDSAAVVLSDQVRARLRGEAAAAAPVAQRSLDGALVDALRGRSQR